MQFDYGDTSLIQKKLTFLRMTKSIRMIDSNILRETYGGAFNNVDDLIATSQTLERYNDFWDMAFPLVLHPTVSPPKANDESKKYVLTSLGILPFAVKTVHGFDMSPQLRDWVLTHPMNCCDKELELNTEDPAMKFFLKRVLFNLGTKNISFEMEFIKEVLLPINNLIQGATSFLSNKLDNFQIISYAPGSTVIYTTNSFKEVSEVLAHYKCAGFIQLMEANHGIDWYLRNFK